MRSCGWMWGWLGCLAFCLASCADAPPGWTSLALQAQAEFEPGEAEIVLEADRRFRRRRDEEGQWLETRLVRADWTFLPESRGGAWSAPIAVTPQGRSASGIEARLADYDYAPQSSDPSIPWRFPPGSFATLPARLLLKLEPGDEPPAETTLSVFAGRTIEGAGPHRITGRRFSGDGFSVETGGTVRLVIDVPEKAQLRFATALEPCFGPPSSPQEGVRFRVAVNGESVFQHEERELGSQHYERHAVDLEAGRRTITFGVEGGFAYSSFLAPRLVPRDTGGYGARPWGKGRPDIIVFLADTLRADGLAAYGATKGLMPNVDAFGERSLVFRRAWSTGTYTLPAHASMFTGAFPHQVGIVGTDNGVPGSMTTIAEHLRDHGYRTGAITDSVVVTNALGLAQGFEWFDELHATLGSTLQRTREFLDDDDGRPIFLFVHTYRAHLPYRVSRKTREEWGERLGLEGDPNRLRARIQELVESPADTPGRSESIVEALELIERHYWGGVVDLDKGFQRFLTDLDERGLTDVANVLFASDHGEAFGEHGAIYHREKVWDVLARIPLILSGPGISPGVVDHAASLVDLPSTLADLAGIDPRAEWLGTPLLRLTEDRPAFVFECRNHPESTLAVIDGPHKVISYERAELLAEARLLGAFDLDADPDELTNAVAEGEEWPKDLFERVRPALETLLIPLTDPVRAQLSAERLDDLRAMGYGGD